MSKKKLDAANLKAGGIVNASTASLPDAPPTSILCALAYHHPALGASHAVVRLTDEILAQATTLEMEVLGFDRSQDRGVVGQARRRGLGFPAWALVNDPEHARFALEVVKAFKKEARRARSKPGHAKTGIDAIAKGLGSSVPHFLPSFYEEAGRAFIEGGSSSYAAQCFEKAREAERVHALEVNEEERRQSFLEFALAGAVTIKSLASYAKELGKGHEPATAYRYFRTLCVSRTLGGMPPWGAMAKDLKQLAKKAKLDVKEEEQKLIEEIAEAPSLAKAPMEFWKNYRKPLASLAKKNPKLQGTLLNLFPSPSPAKKEFDGFWLDLLDDCGALDGLTAAAREVPQEAAPRGGPAAWLTRWSAHVTRSWNVKIGPSQTFALLRRMAERLKADDSPVTFADKYGRQLDLDLCEAALELGVPLAEPTQSASFNLATWAKQGTEEERGLNPVNIAAKEHFKPLLMDALDNAMGKEPFESLARERSGFEEVRRTWLVNRVGKLAHSALPGLEQGIRGLNESTTVHTFEDYHEVFGKLQSVDASVALARTLRGGIFDELGWPALEEAVAELCPDGKVDLDELELRGYFPYAILSNAIKAIVVGPQGRALEVDLDLPKGATLEQLFYSQGQLMVIYRRTGKSPQGYWSGQRSRVFDLEHRYSSWQQETFSQELEDGSVTFGDRVLMAGDTERPNSNFLYSDGETFYKRDWTGSEWKVREFDPRTGEKGRATLPTFFEEFIDEERSLEFTTSNLLPLPKGLSTSPLGSKEGMIGVRASFRKVQPGHIISQATRELETIDGRKWKGTLGRFSPVALLRLPGDERDLPITLSSTWSYGGDLVIWDSEGKNQLSTLSTKNPWYAIGWPIAVPLHFWHNLTARDEAGSKALRSLTNETARALLDAALLDLEAMGDVDLNKFEKTNATMAKHLPEVTHGALLRGILGITALVARTGGLLKELITSRDPSLKDEHGSITSISINDKQARAALSSVLGTRYAYYDYPMSQQIATVSSFFARTDRSKSTAPKVPNSNIGWEQLIGRIGAVAYLAARASTSDEHRILLRNLLSLWSETAFEKAAGAGNIRVLQIEAAGLPKKTSSDETGTLFVHNDNDFFVTSMRKNSQVARSSTDHHFYTVIEHAPSGRFELFPEVTLVQERQVEPGWGGKDVIRRFLERLDESGPLPFERADAEAVASGTGLSYAEAALLWAGLPNIEAYDKNFIPKDLRTSMGLKVAEANAARETFKALSPADRASLYGASIPEEPDAIFDGEKRRGNGGHVERLIGAWNERFGKRVALPQELVVAVDKDLDAPLDPTTVLAAIAEPTTAEILNEDGRWSLTADAGFKHSGTEPAYSSLFSVHAAASLAVYIPYLFSELPVGDSIRSAIPRVLDLARIRLDSKELIIELGTFYAYGDDAQKAYENVLRGLGGDEVPGFFQGRDNGLVIAVGRNKHNLNFYFRPANLKSVSDLEELKKLGIHFGSYRVNNRYRRGVDPIDAVGHLLSESFSAMAERVQKTAVPEGSYEAHPLHSVSDLVHEVGAKYDVSEDAAVLYLQTLALIAPTTKAVQRWNDWKPARYKKAAKALVDRELLVEAKRARAGRSFFLPGPWEAFKSPHPPIETWKLNLYDLERGEEGYLKIPLLRFLPLRPLHEIFAEAWKRVLDGDEPKFEEVRS